MSQATTQAHTQCVFPEMSFEGEAPAAPPWAKDVQVIVNFDGSLELTGAGGPEGAFVYIHRPSLSDPWSGVAQVKGGKFSNTNIPASYAELPSTPTFRLGSGGQFSPPITVDSVGRVGGLNAMVMANGELAVGGLAALPGHIVLAESSDGRRSGIAETQPEGSFLNSTLNSAYLYSNSSFRLWIRNPKNPSSLLGPFDVPVSPRFAGIITIVASHNANGSVRVQGTAAPDGAQVWAQRTDGKWYVIGNVAAGKIDIAALPVSALADPRTLRARLMQGGQPTAAVDATLDWPHSRAVSIAPMVTMKQEFLRLQQLLLLADYYPTGYFIQPGKAFDVQVAPWRERLSLALVWTALFVAMAKICQHYRCAGRY